MFSRFFDIKISRNIRKLVMVPITINEERTHPLLDSITRDYLHYYQNHQQQQQQRPFNGL